MTHVRVLAARPCSQPVPLYLALTLEHTKSRSLSHWLPHARYLAFRTTSHTVTSHRTLALTLHRARRRALTLSHRRSHWLALSRFTLPHSQTLPVVWLSHWLSITLCRSHHALFSHAPPSHYLALTTTLTHVLSRTVAHWLTIVINMLFT